MKNQSLGNNFFKISFISTFRYSFLFLWDKRGLFLCKMLRTKDMVLSMKVLNCENIPVSNIPFWLQLSV